MAKQALPDVKVGEVWEDFSVPSDRDASRRLRVLGVGEDEEGVAHVRVQNQSSWVESEIRLDRFFPEPGGFRRLV